MRPNYLPKDRVQIGKSNHIACLNLEGAMLERNQREKNMRKGTAITGAVFVVGCLCLVWFAFALILLAMKHWGWMR